MIVAPPLSILLALTFGFWTSGYAANILAIPAPNIGSHLMSFMRFLNGMASLGHQVCILDFANVTRQSSPLPNTTVFHFDLPSPPSVVLDPKKGPGKQWHQIYSSGLLMRMYEDDDRKFGRMISEYADLMDELMDRRWDLVVVDDIRAPPAYAMAIRLKDEQNTPFLLYSTMGQLFAAEEEQLALGKVKTASALRKQKFAPRFNSAL
ncbi:hypothetical protein M3Y99_00745200 [Aphelenchoides fujianensis]|nr:hypothetical protein M3Y99_00745200 [Aphelenchoides fujianensis]